ncbi:fatty acid synthase [Anabrus simplex]|uniref:fatty acid synthase n=1 Tax=Anabrus simplex TaxID=316456 RepID=UPI0035A3453F
MAPQTTFKELSQKNGERLSHPPPGDEVVISGISGCFPESNNMYELRDNLLNKTDMVTEGKTGWKDEFIGLPKRAGKVKVLNRFDNAFFGIPSIAAESMDPMSRILLERSFEAIMDAGMNPCELRGKNVGVYVSACISETERDWCYDNLELHGYGVTGTERVGFANKISRWLGVNGRSMMVDTACSSSMIALNVAYEDIRDGISDWAIVGGANLTLSPFITKCFLDLGVIGMEGKCRVFDDEAKGYVRSEAVCAVFLQKAKDAKRIYGTIVHSKLNSDGYKSQGITFPSTDLQRELLQDMYNECHIDPSTVDFVEAHGTGTEVGDTEELLAMEKIFCPGRKTSLPIGSVKSNLGHSEGAAGVCSLAKVILCMEMGLLLPNLHYNIPHRNVEALKDGRFQVFSISVFLCQHNDRWTWSCLKLYASHHLDMLYYWTFMFFICINDKSKELESQVVTEVTPFNGKLCAINSFGFGGANGHLLLQRNMKEKVNRGKPTDNIPRLVAVSGRTPEAVKSLLDDVITRPVDAEYINLIQSAHRLNTPGHSYRGYTILLPGEKTSVISFWSEKHSPLWYVFSGLGSQWAGMGTSLLDVPVFADTIKKCDRVLKPLGADIYKIITQCDSQVFDNVVNCFLGTVVMQIGLVDILTALDIIPDKIVGHCTGELVCAYADGCLSLEQTVLAAYYCGLTFSVNSTLSKGVLATVGIDLKKWKTLQPDNIELVSTNDNNSCLITGSANDVEKFAKDHEADGIVVQILKSGEAAVHNKNTAEVNLTLLHYLHQIIPNPKPRSNKWVSSFVVNNRQEIQDTQLASAEYFTNSLISASFFSEAKKQIPDDAVTVEISPKSVLGDLKLALYGEEGVVALLSTLGRLYEGGVAMNLTKLYPAVQYPVSCGTPMIAPLIKWQHSQQWYVYDKWNKTRFNRGSDNYIINVNERRDSFYKGHVIDGRNLFPATGYLYLVWNTVAEMQQVLGTSCNVHFRNVKFNRATYIPKKGFVMFFVMIHPSSGNFEVVEGGTAIVTGHVSLLQDANKYHVKNTPPVLESEDKDLVDYTTRDVYKELRLRGYNYSGLFRSLVKVNQGATYGEVRWHDNWIAFLDNLLQMKILSLDSRSLFVPTAISEIRIDAFQHQDMLEELGDEPVFPVYVNKTLDLTVSGGVQIRGIKANSIARRKPRGEPVLERHQFVPYQIPDILLYSLRQAVTVCVHVLLENYAGLKLNVVEVVDSRANPESQLLAPMLAAIIGDLPLMQADVRILGQPEDQRFADLGSQVRVESGKLMGDHSNHIVVFSNVVNSPEMLQSALSSLGDGGCIIARESPNEVISEENFAFDVVVDQLVNDERILLLKKKYPGTSLDHITVVKITAQNYDWLPHLQAAIKNGEPHKRVLLVAQGEPLNGILGLFNCLHREPGGAIARCVFILDADAPPFDPALPLYRTQLDKDLAVNVLKDGQWGSYRHLLLEKLSAVDSLHSYNNTAVYGDLSSLTWFQGPIHPPTFKPSEGKELVHIYYSALNFRDVMLATGRLAKEVVVGKRTEQECVIGFEFAGRTSDGRRVMGMMSSGSVGNVIIADKFFLWPIPDDVSMEDAVTVPVIYGTVLYAFLVVGHIKKGESVLIHSGTGGVGQAAIHVALHYGLNVFTTVGTKEKREFIKKEFPQIPDEHIGNSRDTSFEAMVMRETGGRGVDLVLNSLAEEKLQASVRCLARGGRFLEIGKFDMANNNQLSMDLFLRGISYHGIMLDTLPHADESTKKMMSDLIYNGLKSGAVRPLKTYKVFGEDEVEQAYRFMASGKHIGKVMIKIREEEPERNAMPSLKIMKARPRFYCDPNLCYVVAGGLGGFGLELADWLVLRRARHLVLVSRKGVTSGYQSSRVCTWRSYGVKVFISTQDISTFSGVQQLLTEANNLAPVGGIFNLAVVLHDAILENQTVEKFVESAKGKAIATHHFDVLTRQMCPQLQQFVVFSSVSCGRGNPGQTNYGMSNSIMERICEARVQDGLPGLAVQWGAIGEVGLVADMMEDNRELVIGGTLQQTIASCLEALDNFLKQPHPVVASMVVAEKLGSDSSTNLFDRILGILGIRDSKKLSPSATLAELGMDSMTGVEVKQTLERDFEVFLTPVEIRDLTILRLKELSEARNQSDEDKSNEETVTMENVLGLDLYSKEILKGGSTEYPPMVQLPSLENTKNSLFMIPGLDGLASSLAVLASRLNDQTFALQLYSHIPIPVVREMVDFLMPFVRTKLDSGLPLQLVGFSFGGLLAIEMLATLEEEGYLGKLVLIDSSPDVIKDGAQGLLRDGEDAFQISYIIYFLVIWKIIQPNEAVKVVEEVKAQGSWDNMLDWFIKKVTPHFDVSPTHFKAVTNAVMNRFNSILRYNWEHENQISSPVMLLRPTVKITKTEDDYGLSKYCKNMEGVHFIEGNHLSVLDNPKTAELINKFMEIPVSRSTSV